MGPSLAPYVPPPAPDVLGCAVFNSAVWRFVQLRTDTATFGADPDSDTIALTFRLMPGRRANCSIVGSPRLRRLDHIGMRRVSADRGREWEVRPPEEVRPGPPRRWATIIGVSAAIPANLQVAPTFVRHRDEMPLVATGSTQVDPELRSVEVLSPLLTAQVTAAVAAFQSPATRRASDSDWARSADWCRRHGYAALPADPAVVDYIGGTLMDEKNISRAVGASHGQGVAEPELRQLVDGRGRRLIQRTTSTVR